MRHLRLLALVMLFALFDLPSAHADIGPVLDAAPTLPNAAPLADASYDAIAHNAANDTVASSLPLNPCAAPTERLRVAPSRCIYIVTEHRHIGPNALRTQSAIGTDSGVPKVRGRLLPHPFGGWSGG